MAYVRISIMKPLAGHELEALKLNQDLVQLYRPLKGCVSSLVIQATHGSGEMGRVSVWESEGAADEAATSDRSMFLRSRLHLLVRRGHQDRSFFSE